MRNMYTSVLTCGICFISIRLMLGVVCVFALLTLIQMQCQAFWYEWVEEPQLS